MTRAYRGWSRRTRWNVPVDTVPWTTLVPPGWQGHCCYCNRRLTVEDWQSGRIAAAGDGDPWHCVCLSHLETDDREYREAVMALARAVAGK